MDMSNDRNPAAAIWISRAKWHPEAISDSVNDMKQNAAVRIRENLRLPADA
jgi:hypothetical protein